MPHIKTMRTLTYTILLIAALLSCSDYRATEGLLNRADSLADARPDSALALLSSVSTSPDSLPEALLMRYRLLQAKALNKAFIPFSTDTTMTAVVEWYDRHGNRRERMMARYLLGCVYRDLNDAPTALEHYNVAASLADTTDAGCDWHTLCRIHGQMAMIFHFMASSDYELKEWENTYVTAMKAGDTIMAFDAYALKAYAYSNMYNEDSVISITDNVIKMYERLGRKDLAAGHLPAIIDVYLHQKNYDKTKKYIDYYERYSGFFDKDGNIEKGKESYYGTKARYYNGVGWSDSAHLYLTKLLKFKEDIQCAEVAYRELMTYYKKQGRADSVMKYAGLYCRMNDSSAIVRSAIEINRTQAIYNYNHAQQIAKNKTIEADNYRNGIAYIACCAAIIMILSYRIYTSKMRKHRIEYTKINQQYNNLWAEYDKAVKDSNMMESDFEQYKTRKENEIKALQKSISDYHDCCIDDDVTDNEQTLRNSEIAVRLHSLAAKGNDATEYELTAATALVGNMLPEFYNTINLPEYKLTEREIKLCVLIRLNFIPSEIAVLFNLSLQRITNIRSSINKKLFNQNGTKQLDSRMKKL